MRRQGVDVGSPTRPRGRVWRLPGGDGDRESTVEQNAPRGSGVPRHPAAAVAKSDDPGSVSGAIDTASMTVRPLAETWFRAARALSPHSEVVRVTPMEGGNFTDVVLLELIGDDRRAWRAVGRASRRAETDAAVSRSEEAQRSLHGSGLPAPTVLWSGLLDGRAATVLTYMDGEASAPSLGLEARLQQQAEALATLHGRSPSPTLQAAGVPIIPPPFLRDWIRPHAMARPALRLIDRLAPNVPQSRGVLVHGDFWTGNILWLDDKLSGLIDWDNAGLGSASIDVAKCRLDLALRFGPAAATAFDDAYTAVAPLPADATFWNLRLAIEGMPDPGRWWMPTYERLGITDLSADDLRAHYSEYLNASLAAVS